MEDDKKNEAPEPKNIHTKYFCEQMEKIVKKFNAINNALEYPTFNQVNLVPVIDQIFEDLVQEYCKFKDAYVEAAEIPQEKLELGGMPNWQLFLITKKELEKRQQERNNSQIKK